MQLHSVARFGGERERKETRENETRKKVTKPLKKRLKKTQKLKKNQKKSATTGLRRRGQRLLRRARDRSGIREDGRRREMEPARVRLRRVEKRKRKEEDDIFWGRKEGEGEQRKASLTAFSLFPASEFLV